MKTRTVVVLTAAGVLLGVGVCSAVGLGRHASTAESAIKDIGDVKFVLDGYLPSRADLLRQQEGRAILIDQCIERYTDKPYVPEAAVGVSPAFSHDRFGLVSLDAAKRFGYHDPSDELGATFAAAHPVNGPAGDPTQLWLLDGRVPLGVAKPTDPAHKPLPKEGCAGEADSLLGAAPSAPALVERDIEKIFKAERSDPRVKAAVSAWSACMRDGGHDFTSPMDPVSEYLSAESPTDPERETAVDDATCRAETEYLDHRVQVLNELQQKALDTNRAAWDSYRQWQQHRTRAANSVIKLSDQVGDLQRRQDELMEGSAQ